MRPRSLLLLAIVLPTMACASSSSDCDNDNPCCIAGPSPVDELSVRSIEATDTQTVAVSIGHARAGTCNEDTSSRLTWKDGAWSFRREPEQFSINRKGFRFAVMPRTFADRGLTIQQGFAPTGSGRMQLSLTALQDGKSTSVTCEVVASEVTCTP